MAACQTLLQRAGKYFVSAEHPPPRIGDHGQRRIQRRAQRRDRLRQRRTKIFVLAIAVGVLLHDDALTKMGVLIVQRHQGGTGLSPKQWRSGIALLGEVVGLKSETLHRSIIAVLPNRASRSVRPYRTDGTKPRIERCHCSRFR